MNISLKVVLPAVRGSTSYPIAIGPGALDLLPRTLERIGRPSRVHVVSDARVWAAAGKRFSSVLAATGIPRGRTLIPAGERSKAARVLERIWRDLIRSGCDRRAAVIAFGGGVVGDLAGFAAASALRGIDFIQVPTTLLAMVDSSVGGKTGINLPEGKNLVGAFHQPRAVLADLDLLRTLPDRELRAGFAEVIKTAAIADPRLFRLLEERRSALLERSQDGLARVISASCRIKAEVVRRDERESGLRMVLNFGHTLAHAIEAVRGYGKLLHGEAVAIGMAFAGELGEVLGVTERGIAARLRDLIASYGLPVSLAGRIPARSLLRAMERDKKRGPRGLRWVLLSRIGRTEIRDDVPRELVRRSIERFAAGV